MLADHLEGNLKEDARKYVLERGNELERLEPKPRVFLRPTDQEFFQTYIQGFDFTALFALQARDTNTEAQANIKANAELISGLVDTNLEDQESIKNFTSFIIKECFLIVVSAANRNSAFRIFSVMNSRGLDLQTTDILKADLIGPLEGENDHLDYNDKWERTETMLSREGFNDLFNYIRMIFVKDKAQQSLLAEFKSKVLPRFNGDPREFIDNVLLPFADKLSLILQANHDLEDVASNLQWLRRIDNSDWIPPTMVGLKHFGSDDAGLSNFVKGMERRAAFMHVCRYDVNYRINSYASIMRDIEAGTFNQNENEKESNR